MAKQQTRTEAAYQKALEIYDARKELEDKRESAREAEALVKRLEEEHRALVEDGTTEPAAKPEKPKRERKPRGPNLGTIRESVVNGVEGIGVFPDVGTLDDVKASVLAFLRRNSGERYHAHELAQALQINGDLVSKALLKLDVITDGKRRGKVYWVDAEVVQADERVANEQEAAE